MIKFYRFGRTEEGRTFINFRSLRNLITHDFQFKRYLRLHFNNTNNKKAFSNKMANDKVLATARYDHTIKVWVAHSAIAIKTLQHADSQVKARFPVQSKKYFFVPLFR